MRENLIGYLLGALDADEHAKVRRELESDPELQFECELLQGSLVHVHADQGAIVPPARLAETTCRYVQEEGTRLQAEQQPALASGGFHLARGGSRIDLITLAGIASVLALLFFPAIIFSRFQSDLQACQNNLRQLGTALASYSRFSDGLLPTVPTQGNRAVAGIYAPILMNAGLLDQPNVLVCPGSNEFEDGQPFCVPKLAEIDSATGQALSQLQRAMGGGYGYTLGYTEGGQVLPVRNQGRDHYAVMADAPREHQGDRKSANHSGEGQNVLYEGGRVRYLVGCPADDCGDQVYLSDRGLVEAGLHANDAVIGSSASRPVLMPVGLLHNPTTQP